MDRNLSLAEQLSHVFSDDGDDMDYFSLVSQAFMPKPISSGGVASSMEIVSSVQTQSTSSSTKNTSQMEIPMSWDKHSMILSTGTAEIEEVMRIASLQVEGIKNEDESKKRKRPRDPLLMNTNECIDSISEAMKKNVSSTKNEAFRRSIISKIAEKKNIPEAGLDVGKEFSESLKTILEVDKDMRIFSMKMNSQSESVQNGNDENKVSSSQHSLEPEIYILSGEAPVNPSKKMKLDDSAKSSLTRYDMESFQKVLNNKNKNFSNWLGRGSSSQSFSQSQVSSGSQSQSKKYGDSEINLSNSSNIAEITYYSQSSNY